MDPVTITQTMDIFPITARCLVIHSKASLSTWNSVDYQSFMERVESANPNISFIWFNGSGGYRDRSVVGEIRSDGLRIGITGDKFVDIDFDRMTLDYRVVDRFAKIATKNFGTSMFTRFGLVKHHFTNLASSFDDQDFVFFQPNQFVVYQPITGLGERNLNIAGDTGITVATGKAVATRASIRPDYAVDYKSIVDELSFMSLRQIGPSPFKASDWYLDRVDGPAVVKLKDVTITGIGVDNITHGDVVHEWWINNRKMPANTFFDWARMNNIRVNYNPLGRKPFLDQYGLEKWRRSIRRI